MDPRAPDPRAPERVVVTGLGVLSPLGNSVEEFWDALLAGVDGLAELRGLDTSRHRTHRGGEVKGFSSALLPEGDARSLGRASRFAVAAAFQALRDSGLLATGDLPRVGVSLGTTMGEIQLLEAADDVLVRDGEGGLGPSHLLSQYPCGSIPSNVADAFGLEGPNAIFANACAAGNYAVGWAFDQIRDGRATAMVAGGVDPFSRVAFTGFNRLLSVAPEKCQPFDRNRKGMMVSEGAGILVLEALARARERGARVYAEVLGYGLSCDAHHMTAPEPSGEGIARAIREALERSGVQADEIDYVSAHGTGTPANDRAEAAALREVFGERLGRLPVSSIKSMLGHTMGAASALEAVACALAAARDVVPPTIHQESPDPECNLDTVPNRARSHRVRRALSNAFAFGGNNSALVLGKFEP